MKVPPPKSDPSSNASELVRVLVRAGRTDFPDPGRLSAVWAQVGPLTAGGGGATGNGGGAASSAPGAAVQSAGAGAALKVTAGLVLGVAVASGTLVGLHRALPTVRPGIASPTSLVRAQAPASATSLPTDSVQATTDSTSTADFAVPVTDLPVVPAQVRPAVSNAFARPPSSANVAPTESEISILQAAQTALHDDPAAALALADKHARRFATGTLAQEREVIAIEALVALARRDEANERGARFVRDFPRSAHRLRIESLLRGTDHNP